MNKAMLRSVTFLLCCLMMGGRGCCAMTEDDTLTAPGTGLASDTLIAPPPYLWQRPLPAVATATSFALGAGTLFVPPLQHANSFVREEMQLFRRDVFDRREFLFDNGLQYLPVIAVVGLRLVGVPSQHAPLQLALRSVSGIAVTSVMVQTLKHGIYERRPSGSSNNSFPSGHTAFAFCGAELLRLEYGRNAAWVPVAGYAVAGLTALMRVFNDRHWTGDVLAGAALGLVGADVADLLNRWLVDPRYERVKQRRLNSDIVLQ